MSLKGLALSCLLAAPLMPTPLPALEPKHGTFAASDGVDIHYIEAGRGVPVLLIHGYTGSAEGNWFSNGVAEALAEDHRVVAMDVRGHGRSAKPPEESAYGTRLWRDALELLDHLEIERAHVHGYSMGGAIVTQLLVHAPERFITASYGGSGVRETDASLAARVPPDREGTDPGEAEALASLRASPLRDDGALEALRDSFATAFAADIDLHQIDIPVLAINGELDRPHAKTHRMRRELRHFRSVVLPGKSHLTAIMAGYIPDLYIDELSEFISRHDPVADDPRVRDAVGLLDVWVESKLAYEGIPGASLAVVTDSEVVWSDAYGTAHRDTGAPARTDTIYSICSISKLFTSVAVLQLRDAGRLRLDAPLDDYLPWFDLRQKYERSAPITLRGLLTHSAGLPRESDHPYWTGPEFPFPDRQAVIEGLDLQETLYPAQRYFQYSNLGLTLAGETVAAVAGQPYDEYVRDRILDPLGLSDTTAEIPTEQRRGRLATGYGTRQRDGSRAEVPLFEARGIAPAAGFASTVLDLGTFAAWQLALLETDGDQVLDANTLREMQRVQWMDPDWKTSWGLGFAVRRDGDRTYVGHGGSCPGFRSELSLDVASGVGAVFMSNAMGVDTRAFVQRAHDTVGAAVREARGAPLAGKEADPDLARYTGLYRSYWGESAIVPWRGSLAEVPLPTRDPVAALSRLEPAGEHLFRRIRDDGERGETLRFVVDAAGRVQRLQQHGNYAEKVE